MRQTHKHPSEKENSLVITALLIVLVPAIMSLLLIGAVSLIIPNN